MSTVSNSVEQCRTVSTVLTVSTVSTVIARCYLHLRWYFCCGFTPVICHNVMIIIRAINLHGGIEKVDPSVSIPETWADFSNRNIQASQCKFLDVIDFNVW